MMSGKCYRGNRGAGEGGIRRAGRLTDGQWIFSFQSGHVHPAIGSNETYIGAERDLLFRSGCRNVRSFDVRLYILLLLMGYLVTVLVKRVRRSRGTRR